MPRAKKPIHVVGPLTMADYRTCSRCGESIAERDGDIGVHREGAFVILDRTGRVDRARNPDTGPQGLIDHHGGELCVVVPN